MPREQGVRYHDGPDLPGDGSSRGSEVDSNIEGPGTDLNTVTTTVVSSRDLADAIEVSTPRAFGFGACANLCSLCRARRPRSPLVCHGRLLS